ncbi:MAG: COQ9-domain-containing protein [Benjaminiella poitrasii]|nr:MAG: COQ9-domain-containing protein [Benjaminiella poitrasii]
MSYLRTAILKSLCSSTVLRQPIKQTAIRCLPVLQQTQRTFVAASTSDNKPPSLPLQKEEKALPPPKDPREDMFHATLPFIPQYGWSMESLIHGARCLGYPSVAHGMFPGGEAGLIDAYLLYQRKMFADKVKEKYLKGELERLSINERVKVLILLRLDMNKPYIKKWPEALAIMARPSNVSMSLKHLADIADDIWYYAGDRSPDMNWYTKRGSLAAIYSAADLFMTRDLSQNYIETERFLDRRLDQAAWLGSSARQLGTMLTFGAKSMVSALANRGGRI